MLCIDLHFFSGSVVGTSFEIFTFRNISKMRNHKSKQNHINQCGLCREAGYLMGICGIVQIHPTYFSPRQCTDFTWIKDVTVCYTPLWTVILSISITQMDFCTMKIHLGYQNWQDYISKVCVTYHNFLYSSEICAVTRLEVGNMYMFNGVNAYALF